MSWELFGVIFEKQPKQNYGDRGQNLIVESV